MKCLATFSENSLYKIKLAKTRRNVLENMYQRPSIVEVRPIRENLRLRFRFTEAIKKKHRKFVRLTRTHQNVIGPGMKWMN